MLLEVGTIVRAHGLRGQVVVALTTNRDERVAPGSVLETDRGPLEVTASAPAPGGAGAGRFVVTFAGITGRSAAEALRGTVLRAAPMDDPDAFWVHELIGCRVLDAGGVERGAVTDVQSNPASDLLVLDSGALVPLRFVVGREPGLLRVDTPAGLFDDL
ncbi:ribosome maturation factor RimM [Acidiferrimicrobium sp. IK]|uniref:ribosome maturation factor RimM n=1 Tax=Acidiferrimicrobium sp. IK TaxID=2871700 RepID=UPI0021CB2911|nr:ribosome maturation factor RimM [Acidiferrimicrobium sp. IK]MCU4183770.1 ribosome maturation factor RimM [Acidiferrimicrobium sp. IK]